MRRNLLSHKRHHFRLAQPLAFLQHYIGARVLLVVILAAADTDDGTVGDRVVVEQERFELSGRDLVALDLD